MDEYKKQLRDEFAKIALQGLLSGNDLDNLVKNGIKVTTLAYQIANGMMEAREK